MSFLISLIVFIITIPIKTLTLAVNTSKVVNNVKSKVSGKKRDTALSKIKENRRKKKEDKKSKSKAKLEAFKNKTKAIVKVGLKIAITVIRSACVVIALLGSMVSIFLVFGIILLIGSLGIIAVILTSSDSNLDSLKEIMSNFKTEQTTSSVYDREDYLRDYDEAHSGFIEPTQSAETQEILNMSETELFKLVTYGKCSSEDEAKAWYASDPAGFQEFFKAEGRISDLTINCWEFSDKTYTSKVPATRTIQVNTTLLNFWTDFFNDLYELPNKYVIEENSMSSFVFKDVYGTSTAMSAHALGLAVDINSWYWGMGHTTDFTNPYNGGVPFNSHMGMREPWLSRCCTWDSAWLELANAYQLSWGGAWKGVLDPMHFSLAVDNPKGTLNTAPRNIVQDWDKDKAYPERQAGK